MSSQDEPSPSQKRKRMEYEIIYGNIVSKANHYMAVPDGSGGRRIIKDGAIRAYEKSFKEQCKVYKGKAVKGVFGLVADVYFSSSQSDLDNALKTLLDCLQGCGAFADDNKCICIEARKHIDRVRPRVRFALKEFEPSLL